MNDLDRSDDIVSIGTHLTRAEADSIKSYLAAMNIDHQVSGHHAASRFNSLYYEIKVKKKDSRNARQILGKMRAKAFIESRKCPKCKTLGYTEIKKKGLWERIYYFGTALVQCQKCNTQYPV